MRFVDVLGNLQKARRFVSGASNVQDEEVKDPSKLAEIVRHVFKRLSDLEVATPQEAIEFELEVGSIGQQVTVSHNMNTQVRYYPVFWTKTRAGSYPTTAPILVAQETSDNNNLVLASYVAGRVILRIEPSFRGISYYG